MLPYVFLLQTSFSSVKAALEPLVIIALLLDSAFIAIWYLIGALLGNSTVKAGARDEFYQLIGTAILIAIVIAAMYIIANTYISMLNSTKLMSSSAISTMCSNLQNYEKSGAHPFSVLNAYLNGGENFAGLCNMVNSVSTSSSLTAQLNYPLAATSVIIANLTNQTVNDYNTAFLFDAWVGFLSKLSPQINVCVYPGYVSPCMIPLYGTLQPPIFLLHTQFTPYAGYSMIYKLLTPLGTLMTTAIEFFVAQLSINVIAIYIWPYLIFFGLLFRSVFFTRRLGGLLIAAAIGAVVFLPAIYSLEYLTLANTTPAYNVTYGYSTSTSIVLQKSPTSASFYTLNFFALPNLTEALNYYSCLPPGGNLLEGEFEDIGVLLIPFYTVVGVIISDVSSGSVIPNLALPAYCSPNNVLPATYMLFNAYGIMGITAYLLPLINLLITLSAIIGLSALLGGDTELAGLARLV
ncbi:MAG: hypothetical protein ACP5SA_00470 [Candidatus Micrarchaeia archaeon]